MLVISLHIVVAPVGLHAVDLALLIKFKYIDNIDRNSGHLSSCTSRRGYGVDLLDTQR